MEYAPILVTVYNRHEHLKRCIESLLACPEAKYSKLYIASDAPSSRDDEHDVNKVRAYIRTINGFGEVVLIERSENLGAFENSYRAREEISKTYSSHIRLEDDVIVGKGFLYFMNKGLSYYENDPDVIAICGYLPPGVKNKKKAPFGMSQFAPYGFAKWRDKDRKIYNKMHVGTINTCFRDFSFFKEFERNHPHSAKSIPLMWNGDFIPSDIFHDVIMQLNRHIAIYPPESLTATRGNDGSGVNAGYNVILQNQVTSDEFFEIGGELDLEVENVLVKEIADSRRKAFSRPLNYFIYISMVYVKYSYVVYKFSRKFIKKIRTFRASK